jgi:hypothetical protein
MRLKSLCAIVAAAALLAGCGGDGGSDRMVRTGKSEAKVGPDGRLTSNPDPLTLKDLARFKAGSPDKALMELLFWTQWGNLPSVVDAYDPRIVAAMGVSGITGAYSWLRPQVSTSKARVIQRRRHGSTVFLGVEFLTKDGPVRESFLLRRRGGQWRILYDTLLERALKGYTETRVSGGALKPGHAAVRAGERAAQRYRDTYPSLELNRRAQIDRGLPGSGPSG